MWFDPYAKLAEIMARTPATSATPATKQADGSGHVAEAAIVATPPVENDFEKLAAAGVPREWEAGYARLLCLPPPAGIRPERWRQIADDANVFLNDWADQAARLGWTTQEVFGVSPLAPEHRLDMQGLVVALHGRPILLLTAEAVTIDAGGQKRLRIFRRLEAGAVPIWCRPWEGSP